MRNKNCRLPWQRKFAHLLGDGQRSSTPPGLKFTRAGDAMMAYALAPELDEPTASGLADEMAALPLQLGGNLALALMASGQKLVALTHLCAYGCQVVVLAPSCYIELSGKCEAGALGDRRALLRATSPWPLTAGCTVA